MAVQSGSLTSSPLTAPQARALTQWLAYIEQAHPAATAGIAMGLERVEAVRRAMNLHFDVPLFTVGGTNGKGSTCVFLEAMLRAAGYRTGLYTSPHLLRYNERVRINGIDQDDDALCQAFAAVEAGRLAAGNDGNAVTLTYFEYGTLAAAWLFVQAGVEAVILEVGLGGRLDAVNVFDPDCAIVTSIGIDHVDYLGPTREHIGFEKAGIFRAGVPAVCGDSEPPARLLSQAETVGAKLLQIGRDFGYQKQDRQWLFWDAHGRRGGLAHPALRGTRQLVNASVALAALGTLHDRLPVSMQAVREGLMHAELRGRFQVLPGRPVMVLDVAHNPHAAAVLEDNLSAMGFHPDSHAVVGMMQDKDMQGVFRALAKRFSAWHCASLPGPRGASAAQLAAQLQPVLLELRDQAIAGGDKSAVLPQVFCYDSPSAALHAAKERAGQDDRICIFGSFLTVADVLTSGECAGG